MRIALLILLLASSVAALVFYRQISELQDELAAARSDNSRLVLQLANRKAATPSFIPSPTTAPPTPSATDTAAPVAGDMPRSQSSIIWRARWVVSDIEDQMAITPEERNELSDRLIREFGETGATLNTQERAALQDRIINEVLGIERGESYRKAAQEAQEREFNESVNKDVIILSKRLNLAPAQEEEVRRAVINAEKTVMVERKTVSAKMREAMNLHFEGDAGKEQLQLRYDEIKSLSRDIKQKRDELIFAALNDTLSDEQKNQLLAIQSESR